jgi:peptidoglycan hydrolase FlgJ
MKKQDFVTQFYPIAKAAGDAYNVDVKVILAQGAHESAWGGAYAALNRRNYFGILATGAPNQYWDGKKSASRTNPKLVFRIYKTPLDSFMDFARLISSKYKAAASVSQDSAKYAKAIAYSPYISETNGDNRPAYEAAINSNVKFIETIYPHLKKKDL